MLPGFGGQKNDIYSNLTVVLALVPEVTDALADHYISAGNQLYFRHLGEECLGLLRIAADLFEVNIIEPKNIS